MTAKDTTPQFDVGDYVRVTRRPRILEKRSLTSKWSQDLYEVVDIDDRFMPLMYEVKNMESGSKQKCYHWELLASKCKPQPAPPVTRSKSRKEPNALRDAARSHRPITRSQNGTTKWGDFVAPGSLRLPTKSSRRNEVPPQKQRRLNVRKRS